MKTDDECKRILSKLGLKHGVSPRIIADTLLDESDKDGMRSGEVTPEQLDCAVGAWLDAGMPDYAHGKTKMLSRPIKK